MPAAGAFRALSAADFTGDDEGIMDTIGNILDGKEPTAEPVEEPAVETGEIAQPEAEAETPKVERPRDPETGKFIPKGEPETAESAPPAPQEDPATIPFAALKDERGKRQIAEQERDELRQQLARFQQSQQPQPQPEMQPPPDRWEDPEGYDQWLVNQAANAARDQAIQAFNYQRILTDAAQFRADKPDYDAAINQFGLMAQNNPGLIEQMQQAPSPAKFAYDTAKLQMEIQQHGGIEGLIEARMKAREAQALQSVAGQLPQSAPPTISADRSVGARSGPAWSGPAPLSELLK